MLQQIEEIVKLGHPDFPAGAKGIGSVNVSYQIPEEYLKNPILANFTANMYGIQYLTMVYPYIIGNVDIVRGGTTFA